MSDSRQIRISHRQDTTSGTVFSDFRPVIKKHILLCSLVIAAGGFVLDLPFLSDAAAEEVTVESKGKDLQVAQTNARVNATREIMNSITAPEFQKSKSKEIRSSIIARPESFTGEIKILEQNTSGKNIVIKAIVDVDTIKLTEELKKLGAEIKKPDSVITAERNASVKALADRIFGIDVTMNPKSEILPAVNSAEPVSETVIPGVYLSVPEENTFSPGDFFAVTFKRPLYTELTRNIKFMVTPADVPVDLKSSEENRSGENIYSTSDNFTFVKVMAPVRSGSYELRIFNSDEKNNKLIARYGFKVTDEYPVGFFLARDTFAPKEQFFVNMTGITEDIQGKVFIVAGDADNIPLKDQKIVSETRYFTDLYAPRIGSEITAPETEGDYSMLVYSDCLNCDWMSLNSGNLGLPAAKIKIHVRKPKIQDSTELLMPAEVYSGNPASPLIVVNGEWQQKNKTLKIYPKGASPEKPPLIETGIYQSETGLYAETAGYLYEPGEYEAVLTGTNDNNETVNIATHSFKVIPSPHEIPRVEMELAYDTIESNTALPIKVQNLIGVSDSSFIAIIPKNTPDDVTKVLETSGDNIRYLNHENIINTDLSIIGYPSGAYEVRLYSGKNPGSRLLAARSITIIGDEDLEASTKKTEQYVKDLLAKKEKIEKENALREEKSIRDLRDNIDKTFFRPAVRSEYRLPDLSDKAEKENDADKNASLFYEPFVRDYITAIDYGNDMLACAVPPEWDIAGNGVYFTAYAGDSDSSTVSSEGISLPEGYTFQKTRTAVKLSECKPYLDEAIKQMTYLDVTLGREGNFEGALLDFGSTVLQNYQFATDIGKVRDAIVKANDYYGHAAAVMDGMKKKDFDEVTSHALAIVLRGALDACNGAECVQKMVLKNKGYLKNMVTISDDKTFNQMRDSLARLNDKNITSQLDKIAKDRDLLKRAGKIADYTDKATNVYNEMGTLIGAEAGGEHFKKDNYLDVVKTVLSLNPNCAMAFAAQKLAVETYKSSNDFIRDTSVLRLYSKWKTVDTSKDLEWMWKEDSHHTKRAINQAKELMSKTPGSEMTMQALSDSNRTKAHMSSKMLHRYGPDSAEAEKTAMSANEITDEEALKFLELQFTQWKKTEDRNPEFKQDLQQWAKDFENLNTPDDPFCENHFRSWYDKNVGSKNEESSFWKSVRHLWDKGCPDEVGAFKAYVDNRKRIENELLAWGSGSTSSQCKRDNMKKMAKELLCTFVDGSTGPLRYTQNIAVVGCECGWDNFDENGALHSNFDKAQISREKQINDIAKYMQREDILGCLCGGNSGRALSGASIQVGIFYSPKRPKDSSCGGSGSCLASGFGCWHYRMPTDQKALDECKFTEMLLLNETKIDKFRPKKKRKCEIKSTNGA